MRKTLLLCALLAGCNAAGGAPAYLLLDADARQAGIKIELSGGWSGSPLLPLELHAGEAVTLVGEGFRTPIQLEAGRLRWVRGVSGDVVTAEVDADKLLVDGPADSVRALADLLAARTLDGGNGLAQLEAPDLFGRSTFLTAPGDLEAVQPVDARVLERTPVAAPSGPVFAIGSLDPRASVVGFYVSDLADNAGVLVLDAEGGFTLDDRRGRWVFEDGAVLVDGRAFALDAEGLRDSDGTLYRSITEVCK